MIKYLLIFILLLNLINGNLDCKSSYTTKFHYNSFCTHEFNINNLVETKNKDDFDSNCPNGRLYKSNFVIKLLNKSLIESNKVNIFDFTSVTGTIVIDFIDFNESLLDNNQYLIINLVARQFLTFKCKNININLYKKIIFLLTGDCLLELDDSPLDTHVYNVPYYSRTNYYGEYVQEILKSNGNLNIELIKYCQISNILLQNGPNQTLNAKIIEHKLNDHENMLQICRLNEPNINIEKTNVDTTYVIEIKNENKCFNLNRTIIKLSIKECDFTQSYKLILINLNKENLKFIIEDSNCHIDIFATNQVHNEFNEKLNAYIFSEHELNNNSSNSFLKYLMNKLALETINYLNIGQSDLIELSFINENSLLEMAAESFANNLKLSYYTDKNKCHLLLPNQHLIEYLSETNNEFYSKQKLFQDSSLIPLNSVQIGSNKTYFISSNCSHKQELLHGLFFQLKSQNFHHKMVYFNVLIQTEQHNEVFFDIITEWFEYQVTRFDLKRAKRELKVNLEIKTIDYSIKWRLMDCQIIELNDDYDPCDNKSINLYNNNQYNVTYELVNSNQTQNSSYFITNFEYIFKIDPSSFNRKHYLACTFNETLTNKFKLIILGNLVKEIKYSSCEIFKNSLENNSHWLDEYLKPNMLMTYFLIIIIIIVVTLTGSILGLCIYRLKIFSARRNNNNLILKDSNEIELSSRLLNGHNTTTSNKNETQMTNSNLNEVNEHG